MRGLALVALVAFALFFPAVASADAPAAMDENAEIASPTTVPLEASTAGTTEMTFAIATTPTRGSLGQISSPTCQPTGSGSTDCKANVTYTPDQCSNGPDSFTYTATDSATMASSNAATVTLSPGPAAPPPPAPTLAQSGATSAGAPFTGTVQSTLLGATVDYGDGSGVQSLAVDSSGDAPLSHVYAAEGTYVLTATNYGPCGTTATASERIDVLFPGAAGLAFASAAPGGTATITLPGMTSLTATLTASPADAGQGPEVVAAIYPDTSPLFGLAGAAGQVLAGYDIRAIDVSSGDAVVVTFIYPDGGVPTAASLRYFDPVTKTFVQVRPSSLVPDSLVVHAQNHRITIVIDRTSTPGITALTGTRFAVVGARPAIGRLAVTPRCVSPVAVRSLRLRLTLSQRATLRIRVARRAGVRPPRRCAGHAASSTPAGNRILRLGRHLRPGVYTVSVSARNVHGHSRVSSATFAVAVRR
jgi:Bacterial Ig domain